VAQLVRKPGGRYIDATLGLGGHARAILDADPGASLLGLDRHAPSLEAAREALRLYGSRVAFQRRDFTEVREAAADAGWTGADGILADLGISRWQLEGAVPGLSFQREEPLDMRLDGNGPTAADLVNGWPVPELARLLRKYGEEPLATRIARRIGEVRERTPLRTTLELADLVAAVKRPRRNDSLHPATLTFMALRIAVNGELEGLRRFLPAAVETLAPGGRLAVISFHSLEDRIVKRAFQNLSGRCICPPDGLPCRCAARRELAVVTRKPLAATEAEARRNPLSRSAKLRVAERTGS
jgi:16S rRNA (cytosine1402-N4)-methyltransferase